MPFDYAALEASRLARGQRDTTLHVGAPEASSHKARLFQRTDFAVGKLYDDGRFVPTQMGMTRETAEAVAGRKRDESTDAEVGLMSAEGWTWSHKAVRGNVKTRVPFVIRGKQGTPGAGRFGRAAKVHGGGFALMSPAKRREISAKANAARWGK